MYIDFENGKLIDNNGELSYTFPMFRDSENNLENIIFKTLNSGEIETYISKYNITPEEFDDLSQEGTQNLSIEIQKINYANGPHYECIDFVQTVTVYGNCPYPDGIHSNGLVCNGETTTYVTTFCHWTEGGGGSGGTGGTSGNDGNDGNDEPTGNGDGTTTGGSGGVTTSPLLSPKQIKQKCLMKNQLTEDETNWLNQPANAAIKDSIYNYLESQPQDSDNLDCYDIEDVEYIKFLLNMEISNTPIIVGPNNPIDNMIEYLECFDLTQGAQIIIHADQPVANTNWAISSSGDVGHSFITIKQGINVMTFGFYPAVGIGFINNVIGVMNNDQGHSYDVSLTMNINATTLQNIILHSIESSVENYNLNNNNCTDFIIEISNILGLSIPDCYSSWGLGGGSNPGKFGQFIRTMTLPSGVTRNLSGGNAPANHKGC